MLRVPFCGFSEAPVAVVQPLEVAQVAASVVASVVGQHIVVADVDDRQIVAAVVVVADQPPIVLKILG